MVLDNLAACCADTFMALGVGGGGAPPFVLGNSMSVGNMANSGNMGSMGSIFNQSNHNGRRSHEQVQ